MPRNSEPPEATSSSEATTGSEHQPGSHSLNPGCLDREFLSDLLIAMRFSPDIARQATRGSSTVREALNEALTLSCGPIAELVPTVSSFEEPEGEEQTEAVETNIEPHVKGEPLNPWNQWQHRMRGSGLTRMQMRALYAEEKRALATSTTSASAA